jgi:serine protease Do
MRRLASATTLIVVWTCLFLAPGLPASGQTLVGTPEERAAAIARPAVVYTEQYFRAWVRVPRNSELVFQGYVNEGQPFEWGTRCSGFAVNPSGYIVTAGHCVDLSAEGAREKALLFATQWLIDNGWAFEEDFEYWLNEAHLMWGVEGTERGSQPDFEMWVQRGIAAGGLKTGEALPARVVGYRSLSQGDVALVKIEQTDLPAVLLASTAATIGTEVLSIGYPGSSDAVTDASLEPTFKDGQINSEKTREGGLLPVLEMSAALSGGMSGGPTVNLDGEVVGLNSFGIVGETEAFNFLSPSSLIAELLAQNGVSNELGTVDQTYLEGIDAYFAGEYQTALERLEQVLSLSPTHQQAEEYRQQAARLAAENPPPAEDEGEVAQPAPADEGGGFPVWAIVLIAVGVLAVAALVAVRTRRRPASAAAQTIPPAAATVPEAAPAAAPVAPTAATTVPEAPSEAPQLRAVQTPESEAARFCSNCGHALEPGARFCPSCGHRIEVA